MINDETVLDGLGIVVLTDRKFAAAVVADALDLRGKVLDVVARLALGAGTATGDAVLDDLIGNVDIAGKISKIGQIKNAFAESPFEGTVSGLSGEATLIIIISMATNPNSSYNDGTIPMSEI